MLPSEVYQYQLAVKIYMNNPVGRFVGSSYKSNSYQIHKLFRQAVHQTKGLHSKDFNQGWSMVTRSFDFSSNGDFLVKCSCRSCGFVAHSTVSWHQHKS